MIKKIFLSRRDYSMATQHINYIELENFKCFKKLSVKGVKGVNLFGGKNNVGKTALLEAIELLSSSMNAKDLLYQIKALLARRQEYSRNQRYVELDFMYDDSPYLTIESNIRKCSIHLEERNNDLIQSKLFIDEDIDSTQYDQFLSISVNDDKRKIPTDRFLNDRFPISVRRNAENNGKKVNYIKSSKTDEYQISLLYGALIDLNKEDFLNASLANFDMNLLAIKQRATERGVILKIQKRNRKFPVLLSSLGDGVNRYIAILCAIWASENGILLIDEIENGIHYSNYPKLWKLIFATSREANCQVFITSHSKECIESFNEYQLNSNENNGLYFELFRSKKSEMIKASPRDTEQLHYALSHGGIIRGE